MIDHSLKIAIVGGGPGGLLLAKLLQLNGLDVTVYERDRDARVRQQGATLDLHQESGLKALSAAGLLEEFKKHYRPGAELLKVADEFGQVLYDERGSGQNSDFDHPHFRPEIDRGPLRDLMIQSLNQGTIVWDSQFLSMEKVGERWLLHFKNGTSATSDLVIGADGANSKIRPYLSSILPVYSGIMVIEGCIYEAQKNAPRLNALLENGKLFALGGEKSIILSSKGDGSMSFYTGTKEGADWIKLCGIDFSKKAEVLNWFGSKYRDWDPIWLELFASEVVDLVPRPMYHFPLDQSWESRSDLTIIGDAAHRMPPYAGEGVNMAMLDALELAECLLSSEHQNALDAIKTFETRMLIRASEVTAMTLEQTEALHANNGLRYLVDAFSSFGEAKAGVDGHESRKD